jgi:catechol 2,3-dioxygenase-like lactoylglutathione lyase family enzyme
MAGLVSVSEFDHLVLVCTDVERTLAWYTDVLGLTPVRVEQWRQSEVPFPSVRINDVTIIDLVAGEPSDGRLDHLCLVVEPTDMAELAQSPALDVIEGPATRYGARGNGTSLYVRDPDGTVVELRHY